MDRRAAWVEFAELLRDPDFLATSRRMARRGLAEDPILTLLSPTSPGPSLSTPARQSGLAWIPFPPRRLPWSGSASTEPWVGATCGRQ